MPDIIRVHPKRATMPTDQLNRERAATAGTRIPPRAPALDRGLPDLGGWADKVKALPDLRWEKIRALRDALTAGDYDLDARLSELIDRLPEEWGALASV